MLDVASPADSSIYFQFGLSFGATVVADADRERDPILGPNVI
jgi:hypothetical protein